MAVNNIFYLPSTSVTTTFPTFTKYHLIAIVATGLSLLAGLYFCWSKIELYGDLQLPGPSLIQWIQENIRDIFSHGLSMTKHDKWTDQYGLDHRSLTPLFRSRIHLTDSKAIKYILEKHKDFPKSKLSNRYFSLIFGFELPLAEVPDHGRQRRIVSPFLTHAALGTFVPTFLDKAEEMRKRMLEAKTKSNRVNVDDFAQRCTMDIIGKVAFNYELNALSEPDGDLVGAFNGLVNETQGLNACDTFRRLLSIRFSNIKKIPFWQRNSVVKELGEKLLNDRSCISAEPDPDSSEDLLSSCMRNNNTHKPDDKDRLSDEELLGQITKFVLSGSDTSANVVTSALYHLAKNPASQVRLREECLAVPDERPSVEDVNSLSFLDNVIHEVLRLEPPVRATSRAAAQDCIIPLEHPIQGRDGKMMDELIVKKGESILIHKINTSEEVWGPSANIFDPDRHLSNKPTGDHVVPGIYGNILTFLGGGRHCIGYKFALLEVKNIIFVLIRGLVFTELPDKPKIERVEG